jgi:integrase
MQKPHLKLVIPAIVNRTVTPRRPRNADLRSREHLTEAEVERLMEVARKNRWGHRDATMVLMAFRHGFRPAELVDLRWHQVEFASGTLHVRRVKRGTPSTHPILGDELRALRRLQREQEPKSPFVFTSERGAPFSTAGFARMIESKSIPKLCKRGSCSYSALPSSGSLTTRSCGSLAFPLYCSLRMCPSALLKLVRD